MTLQVQNNAYFNGQIAIVAIAFIVNPTLALIFSLMFVLTASNDFQESKAQIILFIISLAVWISLANITKTIAGDQVGYARLFARVPERGFYSTVFESWGGTGKEPLYSFITWSLYYLCGGSLRLFFFSLSMAIYLLHFFAAYKLFKNINATKGALICGVLVLAFFSQYFVMTLHIIRQMLAAAVSIYAIAYRATEGKNNWPLLVAAPLIHSSAFLLVGLSLIPWLYHWMNLKKILIVLACFISLIVFSGKIGSLLGGTSGIDSISYAANRFGDTGATDGGTISVSILLTVFIPLGICSFSVFYHTIIEQKYNYEEDKGQEEYRVLLPIAYMEILVMIFVLSFSKTPIIQYRFFYYSYSFIPLLLPVLFKRGLLANTYQVAITLFFVVRFFMVHNQSGFTFSPVFDILTQPIFYFFTGNFSRYYL